MENPYGSIDRFPVGVNPPRPKKNITKVSGGDTIVLKDYIEDWEGHPVTPDNSIVSFCLRDQKFSDEAIWTGGWFDGIELENGRPGHVAIKVPDIVSWSLRRGAYTHSLVVSDLLCNNRRTHMRGSLLVEYEATSPQLSIPYKDGADPHQSYQKITRNPKYVTGIGLNNSIYTPDSAGVIYLPVSSGIPSACVLPYEGKLYRLCIKLVDGSPVSYWAETSEYEKAVPIIADIGGDTYMMRLTEIDGVLTSYWEKVKYS